ncbi:MAG: WYL domain-containing protein [Verrucomicrobia bacterium]|jgi:predicted DNA-binding transcriptional regulator YafY|nr:WYL domain-containing protein [Verrucomicrobiota bacterium]
MSKNPVMQGDAQEERILRETIVPSSNHKPVSVSRNATERLLGIHQLISAQRHPNVHRLAREFEVSPKTIKRDIEWMRVHWQLPIEYHRQRRGYFYAAPVKQLPGVPTINAEERFALVVADKAVSQYGETPFRAPLRTAVHKLTGQRSGLEGHTEPEADLSFRPLGPEESDPQVMEMVAASVQHRRALRFTYRKPGERSAAARFLHPYHLTCCDQRWYVIGHDVDRREIRTFAVSRMNQVARLEVPFEKPHDFDISRYLRGSLSVMSGRNDYDVVIEFDAWATDQLRGRRWHPSMELMELPGGESRVRLRLSGLEEVERWVLGWGAHATVIQPSPLVERLGAIARALSSRYETL